MNRIKGILEDKGIKQKWLAEVYNLKFNFFYLNMKIQSVSIKVFFLIFTQLFIYSCSTTDGVEGDETQPAGFPVVTTLALAIDNNTGTSAESGGNITDTSGEIISRGVCWSKEPNPTISDEVTKDGNGTGVFTSQMIGLERNTTYYVRAYATNKSGTSYGGEIEFFTSKIYRGDVYLPSQESVNSFGEEGYLIVAGNLFIGKEDGSDITNLRALKELNKIGGDLNIGGYADGYGLLSNPLLENLEGLEYLASVDTYFLNDFQPKDLEISYNDKLEDLDELNLFVFKGTIEIINNDALKNINGLSRITEAELIRITSNASLTNLDGLENIQSILGFSILGNPALNDINALKNIPSRINYIHIKDNANLADLSVFSEVEEIRYEMVIESCPLIDDLSVFNNLTSVGRWMHINDLGITNLDSFNKLISVGEDYTPPSAFSQADLSINDNDKLKDVCGIKTLFESDFNGEYEIYRNLLKSNIKKEEILSGDCK